MKTITMDYDDYLQEIENAKRQSFTEWKIAEKESLCLEFIQCLEGDISVKQ